MTRRFKRCLTQFHVGRGGARPSGSSLLLVTRPYGVVIALAPTSARSGSQKPENILRTMVLEVICNCDTITKPYGCRRS